MRLCSKPSVKMAGRCNMRQNQDGSFLYELSEHHLLVVREFASRRIQYEMAKDPGYLEGCATVHMKPARPTLTPDP
jgi:hypothetical protein